MSYTKAMKWNHKHQKGTHQVCIMSTNSGFWPSGAFLDQYFKYKEKCENKKIEPLECEAYYKSQLR